MQAKLDVRPVSGTLGAEIHGIDCASDIDPEVIAEIRQAFLAYGVVFFRDQTLTVEQQKAFAGHFGELAVHPYISAAGDPHIVEIRRAPDDKHVIGEEWHTDITVQETPPMASLLYAVDVPPYGGDTLFSCQHRAYETLSAGMKQLLEGLKGIHSDRIIANPTDNDDRTTQINQSADGTEKRFLHPIVRTHPETGRKSIYGDALQVICIDGLTEEESRPILEYLFKHCNTPDYTCRFRWEAGSMAFWDNRRVNHRALNDTPGYHRFLRRIHLKGDRPT